MSGSLLRWLAKHTVQMLGMRSTSPMHWMRQLSPFLIRACLLHDPSVGKHEHNMRKGWPQYPRSAQRPEQNNPIRNAFASSSDMSGCVPSKDVFQGTAMLMQLKPRAIGYRGIDGPFNTAYVMSGPPVCISAGKLIPGLTFKDDVSEVQPTAGAKASLSILGQHTATAAARASRVSSHVPDALLAKVAALCAGIG